MEIYKEQIKTLTAKLKQAEEFAERSSRSYRKREVREMERSVLSA